MIRLLLTTGRGPAECRLALANTLAALKSDAEAAGLDIDVAEGSAPDKHGPTSAIVVLHGDGAEKFAKGWTGSIQWIAQSPIRPHHKRKNWFIGIFSLPEMADVSDQLNPGDVRFDTFAAGGPGGQHQNKTESAVRATHTPTGLAVVAREERSQHRNKALAMERLGALLKLSKDLAAISDRQSTHDTHDQLERGSPVKVFRGSKFKLD